MPASESIKLPLNSIRSFSICRPPLCLARIPGIDWLLERQFSKSVTCRFGERNSHTADLFTPTPPPLFIAFLAFFLLSGKECRPRPTWPIESYANDRATLFLARTPNIAPARKTPHPLKKRKVRKLITFE